MSEPKSILETLQSDRWHARMQFHRDASIRELKKYVPFFTRFPGIVTQMNISDWFRDNPDCDHSRNLVFLRGIRTQLRKKGMMK